MKRIEKKDRKLKLRELVSKQRVEEIKRLPTDLDELKALFNFLNEQLEEKDCNNTLFYTRTFILSRNLNEKAVVEWLAENGGYCDCEVLSNVEDKIESFENLDIKIREFN